MASASSSALAASIIATLGSAASACAAKSGSRRAAPPVLGGGGGPQRFRHQPLAAVRRGRAERRTSSRAMPMRVEQRLHGELRMAGGGLGRPRRRRRSSAQVVVVEIGVEPRQHHGAVRQLGDGGEQLRGRRHRAGRAGGDHRARCCARGAAASASISRSRRSAGSMRPCSFEMAGQCSRAILRKSQRQLPIFVEIVRHESVEPSQRPCRVVMSSIRRARSSASASAAAGCWRSAAPRRRRASRGCVGPFQDQLGRAAAARSSPPSASRQVERGVRRGSPVAACGEHDLVLVDIADRHDARQDRGVAAPARRETCRAPAGRRGGSADRSWRGRAPADRCRAGKPGPAVRPATRRSAPAETAPRREW